MRWDVEMVVQTIGRLRGRGRLSIMQLDWRSYPVIWLWSLGCWTSAAYQNGSENI